MDISLSTDENSDWDIWWSDSGVQQDSIKKLKPHQRINATPNIGALSRKNHLAKHLTKMAKDYE
jgi:tubulin polyglutamylase TTLL6/13